MFGLNGALMVVFNPNSLLISVPTALLGGLAADLVYWFLEPSLDHPASVRLFAFLVPVMFYAFYDESVKEFMIEFAPPSILLQPLHSLPLPAPAIEPQRAGGGSRPPFHRPSRREVCSLQRLRE